MELDGRPLPAPRSSRAPASPTSVPPSAWPGSDLEIGVRWAATTSSGLSVPDGGLMIDLRPMGCVADRPRPTPSPGPARALLGSLDRAAQAHGLATTAGNVVRTPASAVSRSVADGLARPPHGLTCDNARRLHAPDPPRETCCRSAPSSVRICSWGLRGGGGNFGIVTQFEFRLHPVEAKRSRSSYRSRARPTPPRCSPATASSRSGSPNATIQPDLRAANRLATTGSSTPEPLLRLALQRLGRPRDERGHVSDLAPRGVSSVRPRHAGATVGTTCGAVPEWRRGVVRPGAPSRDDTARHRLLRPTVRDRVAAGEPARERGHRERRVLSQHRVATPTGRCAAASADLAADAALDRLPVAELAQRLSWDCSGTRSCTAARATLQRAVDRGDQS